MWWYYKWKQQRTQWKIVIIPDYPYRILIFGSSGLGKTNTLLNIIGKQNDIDKIYLYAKDLSEPKYEFLIKKRENAGIRHFKI